MELHKNKQDVTMSTPLLSVCCLAYNQEKHISQTLESLLMQRTSFPYEIIVHDDASTDGTKEIIEEYASNFPNLIKPIFQKENKYSLYGMSFQYEYVYPKAKGEYIAMCAGDDFWIDPLKLQKQVDFLENHPEYGLVHTKSAKYDETEEKFMGVQGFEVVDYESLLTENTISALTVCLRTSLLKQYLQEVKPQEHPTWTAEDFPTWLWVIQHSKIKYLSDITSVYRVRLGTISHVKDDVERLQFSEGIYDIVDYYLSNYSKVKSEKKIRSRYYSNMISMYFLTRRWNDIHASAKIFYDASDWFNLLWIGITLPFIYSRFIIKGSYRVRSMLFNLFNIYPIKKQV
ncbi:MAG: glycosyltransferase [Dysgonamonadaceae bacterium]|nr:glycosyltransferase [Dysgonamonadaceae bacterium]MDD4728947.1 glycosyltransferase [Dysgonamonadaceae bacterium]